MHAGEQTFRSVCRICHGGCGAIVTVKDGRVAGVKGDPASPMSKGWMCIKGLATPEIANHPDRLKHALNDENTEILQYCDDAGCAVVVQ